MEELLQRLQQFETDTSVPDSETDFVENADIEAAACSVLIDEDGQCRWDCIHVLETAGFSVIPIEKDSFGWLIGGIVTTKGIITYG